MSALGARYQRRRMIQFQAPWAQGKELGPQAMALGRQAEAGPRACRDLDPAQEGRGREGLEGQTLVVTVAAQRL